MTTIRIAYFINSLEGGGAASPMPAIGRVLMDAGAEVRFFALTRRNGLAMPALVAAEMDCTVRDGGESDHWAALRWMIRETRAWGATHIWTSLTRATLLGEIAGRRLGLPVVSWQHNAFLKPANEWLLRRMQGLSDLWVTDSDLVADLTARRLGVEPNRLVNWPIFYADEDAPQSRPWVPGQMVRIGSLGRLHPAKGYDVLLNALGVLRAQGYTPPVPFTVAIAGEGHDRPKLEAMSRDLRLDTIEMNGFAANPRAFLAGQHLYLQPSRREGFCIAAHEAMQAALPVIVSDTGQMARSVRAGETGVVTPVENVQALADALRHMLDHPERLGTMGMVARDHVRVQYSWNKFRAIGVSIVERMRAKM